jgi:hypothetical protein
MSDNKMAKRKRKVNKMAKRKRQKIKWLNENNRQSHGEAKKDRQ